MTGAMVLGVEQWQRDIWQQDVLHISRVLAFYGIAAPDETESRNEN